MCRVPRATDRLYTIALYPGLSAPVCLVEFAPWVTVSLGFTTYFSVFFWFRVTCVHLLPCTALVILNIFLCSALRKADRRQTPLNPLN